MYPGAPLTVMRRGNFWPRVLIRDPPFESEAVRGHSRLVQAVALALMVLAAASSLSGVLVLNTAPNRWLSPAAFYGVLSVVGVGVAYVMARGRFARLSSWALVIATAGNSAITIFSDLHNPLIGLRLTFVVIPVLVAGVVLPMVATFLVGLSQLAVIVLAVALGAPLALDAAAHPFFFTALATGFVGTATWARARQGAARAVVAHALRESEARYRDLVERSPDGVLVVVNGQIVFSNAVASKLLAGDGTKPLEGLEFAAFLADGEGLPIVDDTPRDMRVRAADGDVFHVDVVAAYVDHHGEPAMQIILRDITERVMAQRAELVARDRLAEIARLEGINAVKTQLLNTASHELNTPIAALRLQFHLLRKLPADHPQRARSLEVLERNVDRLARLISDVLDVARQQSGKWDIRPAAFDAHQLAAEVVAVFTPQAEQAGLTLQLEVAAAPLVADEERLTQVLGNLLSNALKFTPKGGHVTVAGAKRGDMYEWRVTDTGIGLTQEQIGLLFQPFSQVHETSRTKEGGTGLGLHISRGIVEAHGGRIWCESAGPGHGSSFVFGVPLSPRPHFAPPSPPSDSA